MDIDVILEKLKKIHSNPVCELEYDNPFHLLIAVILSAQCTDKFVCKMANARAICKAYCGGINTLH